MRVLTVAPVIQEMVFGWDLAVGVSFGGAPAKIGTSCTKVLHPNAAGNLVLPGRVCSAQALCYILFPDLSMGLSHVKVTWS